MDTRPSRNQPAPAPFYLTHGDDVQYCRVCGRHIGQRKRNNSRSASTNKSKIKYCSDRCKRQKSRCQDLERQIEEVLLGLLQGGQRQQPVGNGRAQTLKKGDSRRLVRISEVDGVVFGEGRGMAEPETGLNEDVETEYQDGDGGDDRDQGGVSLQPLSPRAHSQSQSVSPAATEIESESVAKRRKGQKRAEERELVKRVARRAVVFGLMVDDDARAGRSRSNNACEGETNKGDFLRLCEAVMKGKVVEPSFAKGDWSIRWRED